MQKRDEEGPHLAEVYRIKMWLRCLPSPDSWRGFSQGKPSLPSPRLLAKAGIARRLIAVSR
jgi:hypothetical protein